MSWLLILELISHEDRAHVSVVAGMVRGSMTDRLLAKASSTSSSFRVQVASGDDLADAFDICRSGK